LTYTVYIRASAESDIADAMQWYSDRQPKLAINFYREFAAIVNRLANSPFMYPVVYRNVRRVVLHKFPYLVWYVVQDSQVIVIACTHGKLGPNKIAKHLM
jgi:plasmid stabilization system protein ParE